LVDETPSWVFKVAATELLETPTPDAGHTTNVHSILALRSAGFRWAIAEFVFEDNGAAIAQALTQCTAIAVSDGSFKNQQGTSAFVIEGHSAVGQLVGVNVIPGNAASQNPRWSKLGGVAGILEALHGTCEARGATEGRTEAGLNGEQAMKEAFGHWPLHPSRPDHGMLQHIRGVIHDFPLMLSSRWIESHQDDNADLAQLDHWRQVNVECDGLAKSF
jgi:hypothetical protein